MVAAAAGLCAQYDAWYIGSSMVFSMTFFLLTKLLNGPARRVKVTGCSLQRNATLHVVVELHFKLLPNCGQLFGTKCADVYGFLCIGPAVFAAHGVI